MARTPRAELLHPHMYVVLTISQAPSLVPEISPHRTRYVQYGAEQILHDWLRAMTVAVLRGGDFLGVAHKIGGAK